MRLVLDTNVVASALLWNGPPRHLLLAAREKRVELFSSTPLLAELTDVLGRAKFEKKIAASRFSVDELVDLYAALVVLVHPAAIPRVATDPDDDVVIATALGARAQLVVTGDRALLALGVHEGVQIASVTDTLQAMLAPPG